MFSEENQFKWKGALCGIVHAVSTNFPVPGLSPEMVIRLRLLIARLGNTEDRQVQIVQEAVITFLESRSPQGGWTLFLLPHPPPPASSCS